jgi:hypothetical protein
LCCTGAARAVVAVPVFDALNEFSNIIMKTELLAIQQTLATDGEGTINNYTSHIDNSTKNIDNSTKNIDKSITINTEINNEFTWIISHGDDEIVPIPREVDKKLEAVLGGKTSDNYAAEFQSAEYYIERARQGNSPGVALIGSRVRKAANDALVKSIEMDRKGLEGEAQALTELAGMSKIQGHARQLQIANAVAGLQADQLMKLRSMMLVSEAARAGEAQAAADKEARAMATADAMRVGLTDARDQTVAIQPKF